MTVRHGPQHLNLLFAVNWMPSSWRSARMPIGDTAPEEGLFFRCHFTAK